MTTPPPDLAALSEEQLAALVREFIEWAVLADAHVGSPEGSFHALIEAARRLRLGRVGWQPIESAPKDGTEIAAVFLGEDDLPFAFTIMWVKGYGWHDAHGIPIPPQTNLVSWMPLPAPAAGPTPEER